MPSLPFFRIPPLVLIMGILAGLTGCNVAGYEEKMKNEKARIDNFDKENELLDEPIEEPRNDRIKRGNTSEEPKDDQGKDLPQPPSIFLRPPKGISKRYKRDGADDLRRARTYGDLFYVYPRSGSKGPFIEVLVAIFSDTKNELSKDLLRQLPALQEPAAKVGTRHVAPFGRPQLTFDARTTDSMQFYFMRERTTSVAIVFVRDKNAPTGSNDAVEASLRSLVVGTGVGSARKEYGAQVSRKGELVTPASAGSAAP